MEITLSVFLFIYLIYILIFLFFSFFNLYHMLRFGFVSFWAYVITIGYIIITLLALFVSYYYIAQVDWNQPLEIFNSNSNSMYF